MSETSTSMGNPITIDDDEEENVKDVSNVKRAAKPNKKVSADPGMSVGDSVDVVIPTSLFSASNSGECTVLVQIDPQDATVLDFEGAIGAIGRFEADDQGVTLDLKGYQYEGRIHPGPTAMVAALSKGGQLKVDATTDEFVTLDKTGDVMAKLSAVVKGDMDDGYNVEDVDVNARGNQHENAESQVETKDSAGKATKKRKISSKRK